jgi:hypothetical protein
VKSAALIAALVCLAAVTAAGDEDAKARARAEADELVRGGMRLAQRALEQSGGVSPFALVMASDGRISRLQPAPRRRAPSPKELLDELEGTLRERARSEDLLAVAIFSDVVMRLPEGGESNAIHATWEHRSGLCADLYVPYMQEDPLPSKKKKKSEPPQPRGKLRLGERIEVSRRASMVQRCEADAPAAAPASSDTSRR